MLYEKVTKRCSAVRLSKDEARASILRQFSNSEIMDLRRRGDKWVATLLMPKQAEFPPSDHEEEDAPPKPPKDEGSEDDGDSEGSPFGGDEGEGGPPDGPPGLPGEEGKGPHEKPEMMALHELTSLVHMIADKLGIAPMGGEAPGGMDGGPVPPPPGPPPPGGPGGPGGEGGAQEIIHRTKLKPGEAPPGTTPIGSPAFAHVAAQVGRMQSFDAFDDTPEKTIKQAKDELEALYGPHGFSVRQIKRVENGRRLAAKLSRR